MTQITVCIAAILLITLLASIHGLIIKPSSVDSIVGDNNNGTDTKILLAKAGLTVGQCTDACETSVAAMEAFCEFVPDLAVRIACLAVTIYAGTTTNVAICTDFCNEYFG